MIKRMWKLSVFAGVRKLDRRQVLSKILRLLMFMCTALLIWKFIIIWSGTKSPVTVVLSGSMEPAFYRGDVLLLSNDLKKPIEVGDVVVFDIAGRDIPIVHRVIKLHRQLELQEDDQGNIKETVKFLTKGDNNRCDDRFLYSSAQFWLTREDVRGLAKGYIPYVGYPTIFTTDYPLLRIVMVAACGIAILLDD